MIPLDNDSPAMVNSSTVMSQIENKSVVMRQQPTSQVIDDSNSSQNALAPAQVMASQQQIEPPRAPHQDLRRLSSAPEVNDLIGVSVTVTAANAVVNVVRRLGSHDNQSNGQASMAGGDYVSSSNTKTTTINTIVTITLSQTFQTNPVSVSSGSPNRFVFCI